MTGASSAIEEGGERGEGDRMIDRSGLGRGRIVAKQATIESKESFDVGRGTDAVSKVRRRTSAQKEQRQDQDAEGKCVAGA